MKSGLWPLRPTPFADELLMSWIARLAHGNGLRPGSFLEIVQPTGADFAALDWTADGELFSLLSLRTGVPHSTIESLLLRFHPEQGLHDLLHHNWQGPALQYCAACLGEGVPYYRRTWRLACVRVCPEHHRTMRDECPHCGSSVRLEDLPLAAAGLALCRNCGQLLTAALSSPLPRSGCFPKLIDVERRIAGKLV